MSTVQEGGLHNKGIPQRKRRSARTAKFLPAALDAIDAKILTELQEYPRISFAELGRRVGLSCPAAAERVRKLEEQDVITGYRTEINTAKIGLPLVAFVRLNVTGSAFSEFPKKVAKRPEVLEAYRVTGVDSFIMKVAVADQTHLQEVLDFFAPFVSTTTSVVLTPIALSRTVKVPTGK